VGQLQQLHGSLARCAIPELSAQVLEHAPIGLAREQLIAVHQVQQRGGLAPQAVDYVAVIHHMPVLAMILAVPAGQLHEHRAAHVQQQAVIVETHLQLFTIRGL
jgi:hypothetical protein